jgi:hypothetical protein
MRNLKLMLAVVALLALWIAPAWAQDDVMFLNSKPLGPHERPLVKFTHAKHAVGIKCITCHHNYDQYFNLIDDSEGMSCHECHKVTPSAKNRVNLTMAFHKQCKACHELAIKKHKTSGPMMCGDCHERKSSDEFLATQAKKAKK